MAVVKKGNMMDHFDECDHFIICVGSFLSEETGNLIMMRGVSYDISQKFPKAPEAMGKLIRDSVGSGNAFHLFCKNKIGMFQTRTYHREDFHSGLIMRAADQLKALATANPDKKYYLECMWDRAPKFMFDAALRKLPDNVTVWEP